MVIGALFGLVAKPILKTVGKTAAREAGEAGAKAGAKAGIKAGGKELGQMMTKEGLQKLGREGLEKMLGKAGAKIFDNITKIGVDKVLDAVKKLVTGSAKDPEKAILKEAFGGVGLAREGIKQLGGALFPGGKVLGALFSDGLEKILGKGAFSPTAANPLN